MKTQYATIVYNALKEAGINFVAYLPDDQIHDTQKMIVEDSDFITVAVANEGEGVAACAGAWLGGRKPALIIADSGFLVATWPLASLTVSYGIPILVIIAHRGEVGDRANWRFITYKFTTEPILQALQIPYLRASKPEEAREAITGAQLSASLWLHPVAVLLSGEVLRD
ncbi:MAG: sulfopyruvate decarboxylase subunit alpha [Deltaproteobacteria bacterium]|nr:sulfopyruvate decarboxylase subunit alpha [Deltaproteobacteria bacterium]